MIDHTELKILERTGKSLDQGPNCRTKNWKSNQRPEFRVITVTKSKIRVCLIVREILAKCARRCKNKIVLILNDNSSSTSRLTVLRIQMETLFRLSGGR